MKIDSAIKDFSERYDREAITSIDTISRDHALVNQNATIKLFKITESFDAFCEYLQGYASYKIENANNEKASPQNVICESVDKFISTQLFEACDIRYPGLPSFVKGYVDGIRKLTETVDEVKGRMMDADVATEAVGDVNTFVDHFMDRLSESFDPAMDRILWASGYNSRKALFGPKKNDPKPEVPVFI